MQSQRCSLVSHLKKVTQVQDFLEMPQGFAGMLQVSAPVKVDVFTVMRRLRKGAVELSLKAKLKMITCKIIAC